MVQPRDDSPQGLLNLDLAEDRVHLARFFPSAPIDQFVEHYWSVRWELADKPPFISETLPYPSVHLVLEQGEWRLNGVTTVRFERRLHGAGAVFGIKFHPGGFRPFISQPVIDFTNRVVSGRDSLVWVDSLPTNPDTSDAEITQQVEAILRAHLPARDERTVLVTQLVNAIASDRAIVRVEHVVARAGMHQRALQRLFREYVGVSPKWVMRYRLFEAADRRIKRPRISDRRTDRPGQRGREPTNIAWARLSTPSLRSMRSTCVSTVRMPITNSSAIWGLVHPRARTRSTCRSPLRSRAASLTSFE